MLDKNSLIYYNFLLFYYNSFDNRIEYISKIKRNMVINLNLN